jgi:hypothetical protein
VNVRFQPKAWYDEEMCEEYARVEMKEITAEARAAGRESLAIFDNLSGQTTKLHLKNLAKNRCKRHLLPTGMTDELQLIDDGVGYALKNEMGHLLDAWLIVPGNLELWSAEGKEFPMWRKRVLITNLAAQAWDNITSRFNFEAAATRLGMRMTSDGSADNFIRIQGVASYTFTDADGGDPGAESEDEGVEVEEEVDVRPPAADSSDEEDEEEFTGGEDSSDEEDDTAGTVASLIGNAVAPEGYKILEACPPLDNDSDMANFIGKTVLVGWDSKVASGWFLGTVHSRGPFTQADLKKVPTANFVVKYASKLTAKKLNGIVACELTARTHGVGQWWVHIEKS